MLVDVKESKFSRDVSSMALINRDYSAREEYYNKVKILSNQKEEINNLKSELDSMRNDIKDIKILLTQLIGKGGNG